MMVSEYFLAPYKESSYIIQEKSKALFYFLFTFIILVPVVIIAFNIVQPHGIFGTANIIMIVLFLSVSISLYLLKRGLYNASVNVSITVSAISLVIFMYYNAFSLKNSDHISFIFYMPVLIMLTALFSRALMVMIVSVFFILSTISVSAVMKDILPDTYQELLKDLSIDYIFSIILSFVVCLLIVRLNTRNFERLKKESKENIEKRDVIRNLLLSTRNLSHNLTKLAEEIAVSSTVFAHSAQSQAASAEEISSTIEEMNADVDNISESVDKQFGMIKRLIERIDALSDFIENVGKRVTDSSAKAEDISKQGAQVEDYLKTMNSSMASILKSSHDMNNIIEIINEIADQINLLSLNAAIEAARAGQAGRGFAVVADEISKLADRTTTSIKEIASLITVNMKEIQSGFSNIQQMTDSIGKMVSSVAMIYAIMKDLYNSMGEQLKNNQQVRDEAIVLKNFSDTILTAIEELKVASLEIAKSISAVNQTAQDNAAGSMTLADNTKELLQLAKGIETEIADV